MEKYPEHKKVNFPELEKEILDFWKKEELFEKSISTRQEKPIFNFYEGPPSANGTPGIHHVMARTIKDIFCRYKTLKGFQVQRKAGWDTHGLPVELKVEQELGITKDDIGTKISIEEYNQKCRETVMKYTDQWRDLTEKMGYWVDMDNPYVTYDNDYIETVWYLLKELYKKRLLYKGYTIQPFSPKAGSGLSSHELSMPGAYREITDTTIVAQFKVKKNSTSNFLFENENEDLRILAWTTTPWTLPSNSALAVGEKITYVKVKTYNPYTFEPVSVVLAKELIDRFFSKKAQKVKFEDYKKGDKVIPYQITQEVVGKDLLDIRYEQLLSYVTNEDLEKNAFRVIKGDFVTTEEGTGIVHLASYFGSDDYRVNQQNGIPPVAIYDEEGNPFPLVNRQGKFVKEAKEGFKKDLEELSKKHGNQYVLPEFIKAEYEEKSSKYEYSSDVLISIILKDNNKAFKVEKYKHSYPHCWRTDKPVLYYPLDSWFIKTTAYKDRLVELNKTINWKPKSTGEGRFGNWLENLVDWNLSRQRYWGIPLPIWRTKDGKEEICIGSRYELYEAIEKSIEAGLMKENPVGEHEEITEVEKNENGEIKSEKLVDAYYSPKIFDLHRPYVDEIILVSSDGEPMYRETDLIDVWFDSGSMPYAQWHYPFENKEKFDTTFPADFIAEGVDQTRGWFFTLHAIAGLVFDSVAFKNVVSNGLVLDGEGRKMSKRLGNAVDPFKVMGMYGADAARWYMVSNANPWDNLKFGWTSPEDIAKGKPEKSEGIEESIRRFFGTLSNTYSFFSLYANLDNFTFKEDEIEYSKRPESDQWILARLNSIIKEVEAAYEDYEPTKAARLIQDFTIDDVSNWYVRLNRKRFWKSEYNEDKISAYQTLYLCLENIVKMAAPIMPFYTEKIFLDLNNTSQKDEAKSVHIALFPEERKDWENPDLEAKMSIAQKISSLTHSIRKKEKVRVRQPLSKILVPVLDKNTETNIKAMEDIILLEVNVKEIEYLNDDSDILVKSAKPNFKVLGKKYKAQMKDVQKTINTFTSEDIKTVEKEGKIQKGEFEFTLEDVVITSQDVKGLSVANENDLTVALDITLSDGLKQEGIARDFVNRVQNLRKDTGTEVQDRIKIFVENQEGFVKKALENYKEYINQETQADILVFEENMTNAQEFEIEEFSLKIRLEVLEKVS